MKRLRCPKCDRFVVFDETQYSEGQTLVFVCSYCSKEFKIRLGSSLAKGTHEKAIGTAEQQEGMPEREWGTVTVVENGFAYRQELPLHEGDNLIGRRNKGTEVDVPIDTNDPSMDRRHCYINAQVGKTGEIQYTLRDNNSSTGTFLMNEILGPKDRVRISSGAIITLGATTLILHVPNEGSD